MKTITFPFTADSVKAELCGRRLTLARHVMEKAQFKRQGSIELAADGIGWKVDGGALVVLDDRGRPIHRFDGVEVRYGCVYLDGESVSESSTRGFVRSVLYPYVALEQDFSVVVSSHVDYCELTIPRLRKSLLAAGMAKEKIAVVVCCERKDPRDEVRDGTLHRFVSWDLHGFSGLALGSEVVSDGRPPYVVLLHDTCSVDQDFISKVGAVDVGLPHDVILAADGKEIGLWATRFILPQKPCDTWGSPTGLLGRLLDSARSYSVMEGGIRDLGEKDVYGGGKNRRVMAYDSLGIRKYVGMATSGGKP
jgi:hypothetical protein